MSARTFDPSLRGTCKQAAEAAVAADPVLRLVRGWYFDPAWGQQEHWWAAAADGTIVDPTAAQFPHGGIAAFYAEFDGWGVCEECGHDVHEDDMYRCEAPMMICSAYCYGLMIGLPGNVDRSDLEAAWATANARQESERL